MLGEIGDEVIITSLVKTGVGKEMCDDAVFDGNKIITHDDSTINRKDSNSWIAIADGVGGNAGGHEASTFLLEYIHENYVSNDKKTDLYAMLKEANEQLIAYAQEISRKENMATTFTGIFFEIGEVKIAHSGNTRVYALQGSYLKQLTLDHTTYQWLMMQGDTKSADTCNKSEIISCFGGRDETLLKMLSIEIIPTEALPKVLIMTTDGIHDHVDINTFENIITEQIPIAERIAKLWKKAKENGSCDDCSILIMER